MQTFDKIICIGKNYLAHAEELGDAVPEGPVIFLKPPSVLKQAAHWGETLVLTLPAPASDIHYECEIVLKLKKGSELGWVSIGLDMTKRALQSSLKQQGHPWTTAKVFKDSAITGPWIALEDFPHFMDTAFSFSFGDKICQEAFPHEMRLKPLDLIRYASQFFPLCEGDVIFTGTPAGVGAVQANITAALKWGDYQYYMVWHEPKS